MTLFKKKKKENLQEQGFSKKVATRFSEAVEKKKITIAGWLGRKTEVYSTSQKRTGLIIFCSVFAFLFIMLLGSSMHGRHFDYRSIVVTHGRSGVHDPLSTPLTDSVYRKVEKIKEWLDSLKENDTPRFKAILLSKPYLLNNLKLLEQLYQIQSK
jgi:hypothetical protein